MLVVDLEVPLGEKRVVDAGLQGLQGALEGDRWPKLPVWFASRGPREQLLIHRWMASTFQLINQWEQRNLQLI